MINVLGFAKVVKVSYYGNEILNNNIIMIIINNNNNITNIDNINNMIEVKVMGYLSPLIQVLIIFAGYL